MLPNQFTNETYWKEIYPQHLAYWQESLDAITRRHFPETVRWERASLGRNIVFLSGWWVLKLCPPGWSEDIPREIAALEWVAGKLPVKTPELINSGGLDGWGYIIQRRLPGRNLRELWQDLPPQQRGRIAYHHGEILAALHALPRPGPRLRDALRFDWITMLAEQRLNCAHAMLKSGVSPRLVGQVESFLAEAAGVWQQNEEKYVLLHGDLTHLNFLVERTGAGWQITGLMDWGDAKLGPAGHEFISPGVHMYPGDRAALSDFYRGCKKLITTQRPEELMARAMLYYADEFASIFRGKINIDECQDWTCVSREMWQLNNRW